MRARELLAAIALLSALPGCTEAPVSVPLRSLERSGDVAFVCVGSDNTGRDIDACPDFESSENPNRLYALVTQTQRGEVAAVDLSAGRVIDLDPATPGFDFIPTGQNPRDIVATPDGQATFVGIAGNNREGLFAIPTTCIQRPAPDLAAFPACKLPSEPGDMVLVADPRGRDQCDGADGSAPAPGTATSCPEAELRERYKLIVTLPERGELVVVDAQALLDRPPGSFDACPIERWLQLETTLPPGDIEQELPPDLAGACLPPTLNHGPPPQSFTSQPSGSALADGTLYVADRGAPLVHVYDVSDPCAPTPLPPLLPVSYEQPGRVVTTSRVAVSPLTSQGERFVYAIDELEGSVMVFDVTDGNPNRTPLVRPGAPRMPFEPADRIAFSAPVRDLTFALRDVPIVDATTGVATIGTRCDPLPANTGSPGAAYRTSSDFSRGARPRQLRGVFGFLALSSGQVAVIDVEDFDAPCRRPIHSNSAAEPDFRGCAGDPSAVELFTQDGTATGDRTVSGEASCRVFDKHRARAGTFVVSSPETGVRAASLRSHPTLSDPDGATLQTGPSAEGLLSPKLLAVDFPNPEGGTIPAQVNIGTSLFVATAGATDELVIDPALAERPSVGLIHAQPRAFAPEEEYNLIYEGAFVAERATGKLALQAGEPPLVADGDGAFCSRGVQDVALVRELGPELGVADGDLNAFASKHADYVQITSELTASDDGYWNANACGGTPGESAYVACKTLVGTKEVPGELRDLRILEAYQNRLVVEPREYTSAENKQEILELLDCCFGRGKAIEYQVRAGHQWALIGGGNIGFRHDVIADQDLRCVRDCSPRRQLLQSRAFEVSSSACPVPGDNQPPGSCAIGPALPNDYACVVDDEAALSPSDPLAGCIFENLTHRFAVYRGNQPSVRDTRFGWQIQGGFVTLGANLAAQTAAVSPQSLAFVPQLGQLAVVDNAATGLVLVSLDSVSVSRLFF